MGTDIHVVAEIWKKNKWHLANVEIPDDRNYWTFAILADVRNTGRSSGKLLVPISQPRGLPKDMSYELRQKLDHNEMGDHSFSWVTLQEILDYNLDCEVVQHIVVTEAQAKAYRETGETPSSWCAGRANMEGHEHLEWKRPLKEAAWLLPKIIEKLVPLGSPSNVRIVFGFDS